jgi:hypothetical protein
MHKQNKQQMIEALVKFSIDSVLERREWLEKLFLDGVTGFGRLSEQQLVQEMRFRGLMGFEDENEPLEREDDDEDELDDEIERLVMWSGMIAIGTVETTTE